MDRYKSSLNALHIFGNRAPSSDLKGDESVLSEINRDRRWPERISALGVSLLALRRKRVPTDSEIRQYW